MCFFLISVQKFPNPSLPKSDWISSINVECGWGKKWDPPSVPGFSRINSYLLLSILFTSLQTNWNNLRLLVNLINLGCLTHPLPCGTIEMGFELSIISHLSYRLDRILFRKFEFYLTLGKIKHVWISTIMSYLLLMLVGCVDPRGCQTPPLRTATIWGSFEDSETQSLDVGSSYWYSCRTGLFELGNNNYSSYIDLVTISLSSFCIFSS